MESHSSLLCQSCGEAIDDLPQQKFPPLQGENHIRLFKIHKSNTYDATICGTLTTTDLDEKSTNRLPFTAISYQWGPAGNANPMVIVNGHNLSIRRNLHDFLLRYRQAIGPSKDRHKDRWYKYTYRSSSYDIEYVFIDQLCIDQYSKSERNHQVRLMSKIYSTAEHVIAWLRSEPAVEQHLEHANHLASSGSGSTPLLRGNKLRISEERFANLAYWKRLWIHQEVLLGRGGLMFMAGQEIVSRFQLTNSRLFHRPRSTLVNDRFWPPVLNDLLQYDISSWNWSGHLHLYFVVCTYSSNHCEDPRDLIYELQGLVTADERVDVDYSLSTREVFLNTVDAILAAGFFDINDKYTDPAGPSRASSRIEFLRQAEEMRQKLGQLAVHMGVELRPEELEQKLLLDFSRPRRSTKFANVPEGSSLRREIAREHWNLVRPKVTEKALVMKRNGAQVFRSYSIYDPYR